MWRSVTIHPRSRLTDEATELAVLPTFGHIRFEPGQFVVLEVDLDTGPRRSAFSIVRGEGKGIILGIKQAGPGGISSLVQDLTGPIKASIAGPFGTFGIQEGQTDHLFITAGSGITPVRSLLDPLMALNLVPTVIYANRDPESAMYGESFRALHAKGYIRLVEVFDRNVRGAITLEIGPDTACYVCGPPGLTAEALNTLSDCEIPPSRIQTEEYGLDMGMSEAGPGRFTWMRRWGGKEDLPHQAGHSILDTLLQQDIHVEHACEVGVCGACRADIVDGEVLCGKSIRRAGEDTLTCISQPLGDSTPVLRAPRWSRKDVVSVALITGALIMGLWWVPPGLGLRAKGPMNTAHETLSCDACHRPAEGSLRQQLGHNAKTALGLHEMGFVPVGHGPVDNDACMECHDRPNDRHPVSRFREVRFAEQQVSLGVHECNGCHGEHQDKRVSNVGITFCRECHQDMEVDFDPISPSHATLIEDGSWETCMACHDFHGNHDRPVPQRLTAGIPTESLLDYLEGGPDPYGAEKHHIAPETLPGTSP